MKKNNADIEKYRLRQLSNYTFGNNGAFIVPFGSHSLFVIASDGEGWDHVSVSLKNRCPNWSEMCFIKDLFFEDEETVMQLHPKKSDYVNIHEHCLHLWRPQDSEIKTPPAIMVGPHNKKDG